MSNLLLHEGQKLPEGFSVNEPPAPPSCNLCGGGCGGNQSGLWGQTFTEVSNENQILTLRDDDDDELGVMVWQEHASGPAGSRQAEPDFSIISDQ